MTRRQATNPEHGKEIAILYRFSPLSGSPASQSTCPIELDFCHQQPSKGFTAERRPHEGEEEVQDGTISTLIVTVHNLEDPVENCISTPKSASLRDIADDTDTKRLSPESNNLVSTIDEGQPLLGLPPES